MMEKQKTKAISIKRQITREGISLSGKKKKIIKIIVEIKQI